MKQLIALCIVLIVSGCQLHESEAAEVRIKTQQNGILTFGMAPDLNGQSSPEEFHCTVEIASDYGFVNRQHGTRFMAMVSRDGNGTITMCMLTEQSKQKLLDSFKRYNEEISIARACAIKNELPINIPTKTKRATSTEHIQLIASAN